MPTVVWYSDVKHLKSTILVNVCYLDVPDNVVSDIHGTVAKCFRHYFQQVLNGGVTSFFCYVCYSGGSNTKLMKSEPTQNQNFLMHRFWMVWYFNDWD